MKFDFVSTEETVRVFWKKHSIYDRAKEHNKDKEKYYFLDGPPYTSGKVHIGTAWNKALKDMVLRFKRMQGYDVWDRAGYDMHGLPTEHATEKELGISGPEDIENYGKERFIEACRALCLRNMEQMNQEFRNLGVWMDFDNAYQTISKEWMEGEWWLVRKAFDAGRLYEGERSMTWDMHAGTALAKHELEYESVTDDAIYCRFRLKGKGDEYFIIWTTTPWTIPFNLAIMANPGVAYCKVQVEHEGEEQTWILAKDLLEDFLEEKMGLSYTVIEEIKGADLAGIEYEHPFSTENKTYSELKEEMPNAHSILLSEEYVDTSAGTGLVHCAPGCGPEDYEVGHRNGIRPFNTIDEHGYCQDLDPFTGLRAKEQDDRFIELIDGSGSLLHVHKYTHEYPFGERSKKPVIFRTTKQWFLKVEDIKDELIKENNTIRWVPEAAYNAFNSWLENLRDNSISRQRYWGTPLPIWRNIQDEDDYIVVENAKELADLAGCEEPSDLHINTVDRIRIEKDGKTYERVPDVLDVWVDAGSASWNCLGYPQETEDFEKFPADFILEGKDQIRGWFNLLHVASMIAFNKKSFKACYMHGFVNDAQGRKMSKSLGNYILPAEVTEKYGVDATRYYMISAANPGYDMNYNFDDLEVKFKNLLVYWNVLNYLLDLSQQGVEPVSIDTLDLGLEEKYVLAKLQSTVRNMTAALESYRLNEAPGIIEGFLLDLSRTYIQLTRDKANGTDKEQQTVASVLLHCLLSGMTMFAPIAPYFAEHVYLQLREAFSLDEESVHFRAWPQGEDRWDDEGLLEDMDVAKNTIAAIMEARDKAQLGVRWPICEVRIETKNEDSVSRMAGLIRTQTNVKQISFERVDPEIQIKPNYRNLGKEFGEETGDVINMINSHAAELKAMIRDGTKTVKLENKNITRDHLHVERSAPEPYVLGSSSGISVYLDTSRSDELDKEGYARELMRRVQQMRKDSGLVKADRIDLRIVASGIVARAAEEYKQDIADRCGASSLKVVDAVTGCKHHEEFKVNDQQFSVGF